MKISIQPSKGLFMSKRNVHSNLARKGVGIFEEEGTTEKKFVDKCERALKFLSIL